MEEKPIDWKTISPEEVDAMWQKIPKKGEKAQKVDWASLPDSTLRALPQKALLQARTDVGVEDQELQNRMADYEYFAFMKEQVKEDPLRLLTAVPLSVGWTYKKYIREAMAKAGAIEETGSRSEASPSQVMEGVKGAIAGGAEVIKPWMMYAKEKVATAAADVKPWEMFGIGTANAEEVAVKPWEMFKEK